MAAPKEIVDLVERFESNLVSYKSGHYNETQVRREFVDPFFKSLGWDIDNEQGFAEAYKDVIHEDAVKVGTTTKAPDYSFRIGGQRKFFLEAKKPSVDIKDDIHPAFQLRRYAWTMKLPLSVLTDFEEFAVYDCSVKPDKMDKASNARVFYLNYKDYLTRWDEIAGIFSKNAVLKGSFDKYAADKKSKRGTSAVDVVFLEEIAGWREILARNIALRNPDLSTKDLNYAVQAIVNRIVFLRICEDRGIERLMKLQDLLNGERVYPRLCEIFRQADERYNSGIFHFEPEAGRESPDTLTLSLNIDDKPLKDIFKRLYYPDSPYEFSVLPAEILGQVYEQFLGKVIRLTEGHRAVIEDKPEVKKAGGVKYTPVYIVENIVGNTLGHILKGKTPIEVVLITVLDPACGSGSFLIVAYQYLLDWHRDWYVQNIVPLLQSGLKPSSPEIRRLIPGVETGKKGRKIEVTLPIFQSKGGEWRLTTAERKRILLSNIYGVDIDRQAVEVTKLSLLLKVLEGENDETISKQLTLFQERALPDLGNNIKCGNSLIGWDILKDQPGLTQEEIDRINPFDWEKEFPEVFQKGGFSVVIGNPPYIQLSMEAYYNEGINIYLCNKYTSSMGRLNTFGLFIERSLKHLVAPNGFLSFIVPNTILTQEYYQELRLDMLKIKLINIINFKHPVFKGAVVETIVFGIQKTPPDNKNMITIVECDNKQMTYESKEIAQDFYYSTHHNSFLVKIDENNIDIKNALEKNEFRLGDITNINQAIALKHDRSKSLFKQRTATNFKPVLDGRNIKRYVLEWGGEYLAYDINNIHSCKRTDIFEAEEKIFFRRVGDRLIATYDNAQFYALNTLVVITMKSLSKISLKYILGLINSKLLNYYYENYLKSTKKVFSEIQARQIAQLPIRTIDFSNFDDTSRHDRMASLVEQMLSLHKQAHEARTPHEQTSLQRQIEATDGQIDALVYELYGLTEEEIRIVEGT